MTDTALAPRDHLVTTPKGNVFVREIPGDDPPIVLMHGFPDDHGIYGRLLPLLSPRRAVAFDWRGYGRSERAAGEQDKLVDTGELRALEVPVSIIFGGSDRYLDTSLAREIAGLFTDPSLHVVPDLSHWPQYDQPQLVADLLASLASTWSQR